MTMDITRDHRAARNQATIAFADTGAGASTLKFRDAPGGMLLAVRTLAKPCGTINVNGEIVLAPSSTNDLVLVTGKPLWCDWCNGDGAVIAGDVVTDENGDGPFRISGTSIGEEGQRTGMIYAGGVVVLDSPMIVG